MYFYIDTALAYPDADLYVAQLGPFTIFEMCSAKAFEEFEALVPAKIDRHDHKGLPLERMGAGIFPLIQSHANWSERRKFIMKTLGVN
mmetsp:Transcript_30782/g.35193  ORF Transcript_30782/g.35193 Transcript_30782/m.35193 type:complete len:88 (-) Transcript_30782:134-397(-)